MISIHTLRVEGDNIFGTATCYNDISIHTLRVEGDFEFGGELYSLELFLSTPSVWRVT